MGRWVDANLYIAIPISREQFEARIEETLSSSQLEEKEYYDELGWLVENRYCFSDIHENLEVIFNEENPKEFHLGLCLNNTSLNANTECGGSFSVHKEDPIKRLWILRKALPESDCEPYLIIGASIG